MIFAGNLKENLTIFRVEETQSKSGYKSQTEVELFTVKAERTKNKENYGVDAGELFHTNELTFRCRKRDIRETDIVKYNGERYRITSLNVWPKDNEITMILARINE